MENKKQLVKKMDFDKEAEEWAKFLDSNKNPFPFITPENSATVKLFRDLAKEEENDNIKNR